MKQTFVKCLKLILEIRFIPHIIIYYLHPKYKLLKEERNYWFTDLQKLNKFNIIDHLNLFRGHPEYRSVFYFRIGILLSFILQIIAKGQVNLFLDIDSSICDVGLLIIHGHSTRIGAHRIGKHCQIWQNVTVGNTTKSNKRPRIGDNVKICTGAIVVGDIIIGNNVTIAAGTVLTKSVPDNCLAVGNPARIIMKNIIDKNSEESIIYRHKMNA